MAKVYLLFEECTKCGKRVEWRPGDNNLSFKGWLHVTCRRIGIHDGEVEKNVASEYVLCEECATRAFKQ